MGCSIVAFSLWFETSTKTFAVNFLLKWNDVKIVHKYSRKVSVTDLLNVMVVVFDLLVTKVMLLFSKVCLSLLVK